MRNGHPGDRDPVGKLLLSPAGGCPKTADALPERLTPDRHVSATLRWSGAAFAAADGPVPGPPRPFAAPESGSRLKASNRASRALWSDRRSAGRLRPGA